VAGTGAVPRDGVAGGRMLGHCTASNAATDSASLLETAAFAAVPVWTSADGVDDYCAWQNMM